MSANVVTISENEQAIHDGRTYDYQERFLAVANDATIEIILEATTKDMHLVVITDAEGKTYFDSFGNPTYTGGTDGNVFDRKIGENVPSATGLVKVSPTITDDGDTRFEQLILGGTGPQSTGGTKGSRSESILTAGNKLLIRWTNKSGQAKDYGISVEWYEE